jgi:Eisosome component PIL1
LKEAYDLHFAAVIERAEKQIILARHGRTLLNYLDDTPVVPGDARVAYENEGHAHQVLADAEQELHGWKPTHEPIEMKSAGLESNLMPPASVTEGSTVGTTLDGEDIDDKGLDEVSHTGTTGQGQHLAQTTEKQPPYPVEQEESVAA